MRGTLSFSDELIEDLVRETGAKNKTQAIEDFLYKRRLKKLLSLQGKMDLKDNWKEVETLETEERTSNHFDHIPKLRRHSIPGK